MCLSLHLGPLVRGGLGGRCALAREVFAWLPSREERLVSLSEGLNQRELEFIQFHGRGKELIPYVDAQVGGSPRNVQGPRGDLFEKDTTESGANVPSEPWVSLAKDLGIVLKG